MNDPTIYPTPTDEEAVAIAAAVSAAWPQPAPPAEDVAGQDSRWRFSGRWWNRSAPAPRRRRPRSH